MAKLYAVAQGEYSDYGICAIFSTEEKAREYCRLHNTRGEDGTELKDKRGVSYWPDFRIEEYELDPDMPNIDKNRHGYTVYMTKDGEVSVVRPSDIASAIQYPNRVQFSGPGDKHYSQRRFYRQGDESLVLEAQFNEAEFMQLSGILAKDEKHALKIASEKRAELLALGRWPTKYDVWGKPV